MNQGLLGIPTGRGDLNSPAVRRPWGYINGSQLPNMPSRTADKWYQNTESESISVVIQASHAAASGFELFVSQREYPFTDVSYITAGIATRGQLAVSYGLVFPTSSMYTVTTFEVPSGWYYGLKTNTSGYTIQNWAEIRRSPA